MTQFYTKVKLYLEANSKTWEAEQDKIELQDDGDGVFIRTWNVNGLAKPTDEQIASYEASAVVEENLETISYNRANDYPSIVDQLDKIYHSGIDEWKKVIKATKDKFPKE